jgi:hypothetical protein
MRPDGGQGETPEQMKKRADDLRECARKARRIAGALAPYLDGAVNQATPAIWTGTYAQTSTATLADRRRTLREMANDLMQDAFRWENEARNLDDQADQGKKTKTGGS